MPPCNNCHRDAPDGALYCPFCRAPILPAQAEGEPVDPFIGQTVKGTYFIQQKIGEGGMGQVYKAVQVNLDRTVALKLLRSSLQSDASLVQRFHREARAASRLHHPNVIAVTDFGQAEDGTLFMAMEYVAGRNLTRLLREEFPLAERRIVDLAAQVLSALAEAHAAGVVHRDLKPENIMVESRRGEPDFVKVLDFGIAKIQESDTSVFTRTGMVCGTPDYMSPEQAKAGSLDARSDLYSMGVILYELLTGKVPFEAPTPLAVIEAHLTAPPPPLAERVPPGHRVSPELEGLVMRALAKNPDDRFASAEEMRQQLLACPLDPELAEPTVSEEQRTLLFADSARAGREAGTPRGTTPRAATPPRKSPSQAGSTAAGRPAPGARPQTPLGKQAVERPRTPVCAQAPAAGRPVTPPAGGRSPTPGAGAPRSATPAHPPLTMPLSHVVFEAKKGEQLHVPVTEYDMGGSGDREKQPEVPKGEATVAADVGRRPPMALILAGSAIALVAVGAGAYWVLGSKGGHKSVTGADAVAAPTTPASPLVRPATPSTPEPKPPPPGKPEPTAPIAVSTVPVPPPIPGAGSTPEAKPTSLEKPEPAEPATHEPAHRRTGPAIRAVREGFHVLATPPASSGEGVLAIVATPWANVSINGRPLGETPREVRLAEGTYRVRASHPALGTVEKRIDVVAGKRKVWNATFAK